MSLVTDRISSGYYLPEGDVPKCPELPGILKVSVSDLSDEAVDDVAAVRNDYEGEFAKYRIDIHKYTDKILDGLRTFKEDVEKEFGLVDNPRAEKFYNKALEHTCGYEDLYLFYVNFSDLIK